MTSILYQYYKENCGAYNNIFVDMKGIYYLVRFSPLTLFLLSIVLSIIFSNSLYLILGAIIVIILMFSLLAIVHREARKIVVKKKFLTTEYKGRWNNAEVLAILNNKDKIKLAVFLEERRKKEAKYLYIYIKEVDALIELNKPKFPVIPAVFGGLIVAWYSALTSWLFKMTIDISMMWYPVTVSLAILFLIFLFYIVSKMTIETINDIFWGQEYQNLKKFRNRLEELLFDLEDN